MLLVVWLISLYASHSLSHWVVDRDDPLASAVGLAVQAAAILIAGRLSCFAPLPNPHMPIAFAWSALMGMFLSITWMIYSKLGLQGSERSFVDAAPAFAIFFAWGFCVHKLIELAFGAGAVGRYWQYVSDNYSTFRKS